jgi:hypothetical protein
MLGAWLRPTSLASFRNTYWRQAPLARAGTTLAARALLDWDVVGRVLARTRPAPDVLVVAAGREAAAPVPRSLPALRSLMRAGIGLCIRHAERCDPGLAALAAAFERDAGTAQVQLFVTPGGTYGFGWHYDDEDVFIAQTHGTKDYRFRPNTVAAEVPAGAAAFARFAAERSPFHEATLVPGDFLYLPARWWHMAHCREDALSLSVGVSPRATAPPGGVSRHVSRRAAVDGPRSRAHGRSG